ncbi:MAG TPA: GAF domain-containing sensor histidine kinase [Methanocella sp.]|uniref:GAF domain-containing sensor histidine kinase n=1 Tax=Methanocella sp. TaxID=2052833 RepID=UPI002B8C7B42|nr:GAF domain-containing sensor histidine kinase [Methanocella sp.]HTY91559.1 GAF domain-containing sensor histidine kinase [Methanocella sp.]
MQENFPGPYHERSCSLLFRNAAMMDSSDSMDTALGRLAANMAELAGSDSCLVLLRSLEDEWKVAAAYGQGLQAQSIELSGAALAAIERKEAAAVKAGDLGVRDFEGTAFLCVPLVSYSRPAGLAVLFSKGRRLEFSPDTKKLLAMMGIQGAHAIDEFTYRDELQKRSDELRRVYEIQRRITQSIDLDEATASIVENAPYITRLEYCLIYLLDPNERNIVSVKAPEAVEKKFGKLKFSLDELVASRIAMDERRPLFIEDARTFPNISKRIVDMLGWGSAIVLPLISRDRVLGVMWLYTTDRKVHFDDNDRRSAIALSDQAANIIDTARLYKELADSYEKLKDLDRTKMEFFTLISHELRNPLAIIKGYTELLYDSTLGEVNDKQKDKLARIRENVDKLADMVGKMSEISSLETKRYSVDRSDVSLGNMVEELADTMGFLFKNKHITLEVVIPENLPLVEVDRKKMEQVILNLLNNALKYTPDGGRVTIGAKDRVTDILVWVSDTGIGIPRKDLDKIFTGFYHSGYKLSYEYKGPGLGLAVSRKIIEGHGGHIWTKSEVGKGSTFYFTIPKRHAGEAPAASHPARTR